MTIREQVYATLTNDAQLQADGIGPDTVWNIEAPDNPDRGKPFVVTAWAESPPVFGRRHRRELLVWAHDDSADYARIDRILNRVQELLVALVHEGGVTVVDFTGGSPDLYDDGFHTITRNYGFRVIGAD